MAPSKSSKIRVAVAVDLAAPAARVWDLMGGFNALPDWCPGVTTSRLEAGGRVRRLRAGKHVFVETMRAYDDRRMSYSYTMEEAGPEPVTDYYSTLRVSPRGRGSRVRWSAEFRPKGATAAEAKRVIRETFQMALASVKKRFG